MYIIKATLARIAHTLSARLSLQKALLDRAHHCCALHRLAVHQRSSCPFGRARRPGRGSINLARDFGRDHADLRPSSSHTTSVDSLTSESAGVCTAFFFGLCDRAPFFAFLLLIIGQEARRRVLCARALRTRRRAPLPDPRLCALPISPPSSIPNA